MDAERKRFEAWIISPPYERSIERFENWERHAGQYRQYQVELCWQAWLAAVGDANSDTNSQQN